MKDRLPIAIVALALALVAVAVYWDARDNEFVWDDPIVFQRQLPYFDSFSNVFLPPPSIPQFGQRYYRPLIVVTYQLDELLARTFWPADQRERARRLTYHLSPIVYHALATMLVLLVGLTLCEAGGVSPRAAPALAVSAAGALLFAVHPIHVESVSWMAGRSDVVCALFFLPSFALMVRYVRHGTPAALAGAALLALPAMLSKETGAGLMIAAPLVAWLVPRAGGVAEIPEENLPRAERRRRRKAAKAGAPVAQTGPARRRGLLLVAALAAVTVVYLLIRHQAMLSMRTPPLARAFGGSLFGALGAGLEAVGWYAVKVIWPFPQSAFVRSLPMPWLWGLAGLLALVALGGLVLLAARRAVPGSLREALAAVLFVSALAPSLAIAVLRISETPLAERYLYIPSAGVCLLAAFLVARAAAGLPALRPAWRTAVPLVVAAAIGLPASWAVAERNRVWASDLAFWLDTSAKAPGEGLPYLHLGIRYASMNELAKAIESYGKAYELYDDAEGRSKALNNTASIYIRLGQPERAIAFCQRALREDPRYPTPHYNWALAELTLQRRARTEDEQRRRLVSAIEHLQTAIRLNPRYVKAHYQLGRLLVRLGREAEGRAHLEQAARLAPESREGREAREMLAALGAD
ncbi:MAG: hypothetical protein Kow0062_02020 [Acidobacteriota bacterium]